MFYEAISFAAKLNYSHNNGDTFSPVLHVHGIRSGRRTIRAVPRPDEMVELLAPLGFTTADAKRYIDEHGVKIWLKLQKMLDSQYNVTPPPLTYKSKIPFMGGYVPIRLLPDDSEHNGHFGDGALYLKPGLMSDEIRGTVLRLFGETAYSV